MDDSLELKDMNLVFMGRMVEKYFGEEGLDKLIDHKHERLRNNWSDIGEEKGGELDYLLRLFTDKVHDYEIIENSPESLEIKVYECLHAKIFNSYNAADLGEKMICSGDYAVIEGYNADIDLERPETAMSGEMCHFKFSYADES